MRQSDQAGDQAGALGRYGILLATLIAAYLISAVTSSPWGAAIRVVFIATIALLALRTPRLSRRTKVLAICAVVTTAVAAAVSAQSANSVAQGIASIWSGLILLLITVTIVDRVIRLDRVTVQSIYAALSAYLLIGLMFASCFSAISSLDSGPFFVQGEVINSSTIQYFSFTTLTTLGYGDFTAANSLGRAIAVLEALTGQVFLATLVARLVSAYGAPLRRNRPPDE